MHTARPLAIPHGLTVRNVAAFMYFPELSYVMNYFDRTQGLRLEVCKTSGLVQRTYLSYLPFF